MSPELEAVQLALSGVGAAVYAESDLSKVVADLLAKAGIDFEAEVQLCPGDRIDFVVGRVGLELKTHASAPSVIRQLARYARSEALDELVLVTSSRKLALSVPREIEGTPIAVCMVGGL